MKASALGCSVWASRESRALGLPEAKSGSDYPNAWEDLESRSPLKIPRNHPSDSRGHHTARFYF